LLLRLWPHLPFFDDQRPFIKASSSASAGTSSSSILLQSWSVSSHCIRKQFSLRRETTYTNADADDDDNKGSIQHKLRNSLSDIEQAARIEQRTLSPALEHRLPAQRILLVFSTGIPRFQHPSSETASRMCCCSFYFPASRVRLSQWVIPVRITTPKQSLPGTRAFTNPISRKLRRPEANIELDLAGGSQGRCLCGSATCMLYTHSLAPLQHHRFPQPRLASSRACLQCKEDHLYRCLCAWPSFFLPRQQLRKCSLRSSNPRRLAASGIGYACFLRASGSA
jgi:hypothetical protein